MAIWPKGCPTITPKSRVELGDSTEILPNLVDEVNCGEQKRCSLLFTSPPYQGVTNYHEDQWLRLWLLGGPPKPQYAAEKHKGKFTSEGRLSGVIGIRVQECLTTDE